MVAAVAAGCTDAELAGAGGRDAHDAGEGAWTGRQRHCPRSAGDDGRRPRGQRDANRHRRARRAGGCQERRTRHDEPRHGYCDETGGDVGNIHPGAARRPPRTAYVKKGFATMSAAIRSTSTTSVRATEMIAVQPRRPSGSSGPFASISFASLPVSRAEESGADDERDAPGDQAEQRPEVAVAPVALVHEHDAHREDDERRRHEHARAQPLRLLADLKQLGGVLRALSPPREHRDHRSAAEPDDRREDVDGLEDEVPARVRRGRRPATASPMIGPRIPSHWRAACGVVSAGTCAPVAVGWSWPTVNPNSKRGSRALPRRAPAPSRASRRSRAAQRPLGAAAAAREELRRRAAPCTAT